MSTNQTGPPVFQPQAYIPGAGPVIHQPAAQYVVIDRAPAPSVKVKYSKANIDSVRGLTITQMVLAGIIVVLHIFTTAVNDVFYYNVLEMREKLRDSEFVYLSSFVDNDGTGIWIGIIIIVTAALGIGGYKKQKKGLIIAHLVLNIFVVILSIVLMAVLSTTINSINYCRQSGEMYYSSNYNYNNYNYNNYNSYDSYWRRTTTTPTTTTQPTFLFYGEKLERNSGGFYCRDSIFRVWLSFDCIMLVCCVGELCVTLTLLVYNSIAACTCCHNCCSCCRDTTEEQTPGQAVSYHNQPVNTMAMPQLAASPQQVQIMPGAQAMPAQVHYQHPPQPAMMMQAQPLVPQSEQQQPQASSGEKWEELPPEYTATVQS